MLSRRFIGISVLGFVGLLASGYLIFKLNEQRQAPSMDWQSELMRIVTRAADDFGSPPWPFDALTGREEPMPKDMRHAAIASIGGYQRLGLRFDNAQYVSTSIGVGIWVIRGTGVTCIFQDKKAAAACATDADVMRRGLSLVVGYGPLSSNAKLPTRFLALGIVPDSAKAIRLKIVDGGSLSIPIVENAYALRAKAPIEIEKLIR